ncbi:MAG: MFS transporter [Oceanicaulis sp.]|nr:MFS transporter [Oceanicaulis sp.]
MTLGSASPHLAPVVTESLGWRAPFALSGLAALASAALILTRGRDRPSNAQRDLTLAPSSLASRTRRWRASIWAIWATCGALCVLGLGGRLSHHLVRTDRCLFSVSAPVTTFIIVAAGALGALGAGWLADRVGRTLVTSVAMALSGGCALLSAWAWSGPAALMIGLLVIYGVTVIADSAQFSAAAAELAPRTRRAPF